MKQILVQARDTWAQVRVSRTGFGKYVVLFACLLHMTWAGLLVLDPSSGFSTPLRLLVRLSGGSWRASVVLVLVAIPAVGFTFRRIGVSHLQMGLMLIPQQLVLFVSAGAALHSAVLGKYADGTLRSTAFILGDQLSVILLALLYSVVILEAARDLSARSG